MFAVEWFLLCYDKNVSQIQRLEELFQNYSISSIGCLFITYPLHLNKTNYKWYKFIYCNVVQLIYTYLLNYKNLYCSSAGQGSCFFKGLGFTSINTLSVCFV